MHIYGFFSDQKRNRNTLLEKLKNMKRAVKSPTNLSNLYFILNNVKYYIVKTTKQIANLTCF